MTLTLLYRGPLRSCNYRCRYCPFGGTAGPPEELAVARSASEGGEQGERRADEAAIDRFVRWVGLASRPLAVFFTPRGEALTHPHYQRAVGLLSRLPHVVRVAAQTNLSARLDWLDDAEVGRIGLWATYHPASVARARFLSRCRELLERGVRFSVGMVGLPEHLEELEAMRRELPDSVYLWVNAEKDHPACDDPAFVARVEAVDPLFRFNLRPQPSRGRACRAGETALSVEGDGTLRRCHFVDEIIGNLYRDDLEKILRPCPCPLETCRCHIGYVHLPLLPLGALFGEGILERIPERNWRELRPA